MNGVDEFGKMKYYQYEESLNLLNATSLPRMIIELSILINLYPWSTQKINFDLILIAENISKRFFALKYLV
jgi:hypothetical protein